MNILIVNKSIAMMRGGGETRTLAFATGLGARGHDVTLLCAHPLLGTPRHALPEGVRAIAVKAPYLRDWSYRLPRGRGVLARIDERLFDRRAFHAIAALAPGGPGDGIDVVLTFGLFPLAWRVRRACGIPTVVANSGGLPVGNVAAAVRGVDAIVADGSDVRAIPERFGVEVVEVRKGVDTQRFCPPERRPTPPVGIRLLFVGRLVPVKSVHTLLPMLETLLGDGHDVRLDVVGDGPLRRGLEREVHRRGIVDRVRFLGHLAPDDVAKRYRDADLFVLPSSFDNYPNAVLEAMASGLPVVAFDVGGVGDQVRHGDTGFLAPPGDDAAFTAHVETLVTMPDRRQAMGAKARDRVVASYGWSHAIDRLEQTLADVVQAARRRAA